MKRRRFLYKLSLLPLGVVGYGFAIRAQPADPVRVAPTPAQSVTPDTAANRALLIAVQKNDPKAVSAAFEQGASANAGVVFHNFELPPGKDTRPQDELKPSPLVFLVEPRSEYMPGSPNEREERRRAIVIFRQFLERGADPNAQEMNPRGLNTLYCALRLEDIDLLRRILEKGANVNSIVGNTSYGLGGNAVNGVLLHTLRGKEEKSLPLLSMVLEKGANPNVYDGSGMTPLHNAALIGLPQTVRILLKHGADPALSTRPNDSKGIGGMTFPYKATPLMLATRSGNVEIIRMLTAAKPNLSAEEAVMTGNVPALEKHLAAGLNPNQKDEQGNPYIVLAAASGVSEAVHLLLKHKADPNAKGTSRSTALRRSAILGHADVVRVLLRAGADPNVVNGRPDFPETALTGAIQAAELDSVTALLENSRLDLTASGNRDALLRAVQSAGTRPLRPVGKDPRTMKGGSASLDAQENIYTKLVLRFDIRKTGGPALCMALDKGQFGLAEDLLKRGADVDAKDREGKTALMLTVESMGLDLYSVSPDGFMGEDLTPAEKKTRREEVNAQNKEAMEFLRLLLSKKPNVNAVATSDSDGAGQTALAMAQFWKLPQVAALLKRAGARR
jgi:ankyrin repeat protein